MRISTAVFWIALLALLPLPALAQTNSPTWRLGTGAPVHGYYDCGTFPGTCDGPGGIPLLWYPSRLPTIVDSPLATSATAGRFAVGSSSATNPALHLYSPSSYAQIGNVQDLMHEEVISLDPSQFGGVTALHWIGNTLYFGDTQGNIGQVAPDGTTSLLASSLSGQVHALDSGLIGGDADADLAFSTTGGDAGWIDLSVPSNPVSSFATLASYRIGVGDLNGDGADDLVIGTNAASASGSSLTIHWNDGSGSFPVTTELPIAVAKARGVLVRDFDGDGDADIASCFSGASGTGADSTVRVFTNDLGDGSSWSEASLDQGAGLHRDLLAIDLDMDGDLDLVSSVANQGQLHLYENQGSAFGQPVSLGSGLGGIYGLADWNGSVVATVNELDAPYLFQNFTSTKFAAEPVPASWLSAWDPAHAGDLDGDGVDDLLLLGQGGDIGALLSSLPPNFGPTTIATAAAPPTEAYVVDMSGDGIADVYWRGSGNAEFFDLVTAQTIAAPSGLVLDWDSDGIPDIVRFTTTSQDPNCDPGNNEIAYRTIVNRGTGTGFLADDESLFCRDWSDTTYIYGAPSLTGEAWSVYPNTSLRIANFSDGTSAVGCVKVGFNCASCCGMTGSYDSSFLLVGDRLRFSGCWNVYDDCSDWFDGPKETAHLTGPDSFTIFGAGGPPIYEGYDGLIFWLDQWQAIGSNRSWDKTITGDFDGDGDLDLWTFDTAQSESFVHWNLIDYGDCNGDGLADADQIAADPSLDCDLNGALDMCQIAEDPSLDWDGDGLLDTCPGGGVVYCDSNLNAAGLNASIAPEGSPLIGEDAFCVRAYDLPAGTPGVPGMFIMSRSTGYLNPFGGGAGVLCLGAPIRRFGPNEGFPLQFSGASGEVTLCPPITDFPVPNPVQPGEAIHFQMWFREIDSTTGLPTSNTTDGIRVMFR